jgi:hypothetical protein
MHLSILGPDSARQEERKTNLKYALFFLAVAVLLRNEVSRKPGV